MSTTIQFEFVPQLSFIQFIDFCCATIYAICITHSTQIGSGHSINGIDAAVAFKIHH